MPINYTFQWVKTATSAASASGSSFEDTMRFAEALEAENIKRRRKALEEALAAAERAKAANDAAIEALKKKAQSGQPEDYSYSAVQTARRQFEEAARKSSQAAAEDYAAEVRESQRKNEEERKRKAAEEKQRRTADEVTSESINELLKRMRSRFQQQAPPPPPPPPKPKVAPAHFEVLARFSKMKIEVVIRSFEDASAAYRKAALATHPDAGGSAADFKLVEQAWAVIKDRRW